MKILKEANKTEKNEYLKVKATQTSTYSTVLYFREVKLTAKTSHCYCSSCGSVLTFAL
jgi:hypothetical protein